MRRYGISVAVIYAADFLRSLNNQTDRDFSLLLINDGVSPQIIDHIISKYNNDYEILGNPNHLSPVKLRVKLIEEAYLRKGNYLILGDIDDYFSDDRIEQLLKMRWWDWSEEKIAGNIKAIQSGCMEQLKGV